MIAFIKQEWKPIICHSLLKKFNSFTVHCNLSDVGNGIPCSSKPGLSSLSGNGPKGAKVDFPALNSASLTLWDRVFNALKLWWSKKKNIKFTPISKRVSKTNRSRNFFNGYYFICQRPDDPIDFLINYLKKEKAAPPPTSPTPTGGGSSDAKPQSESSTPSKEAAP